MLSLHLPYQGQNCSSPSPWNLAWPCRWSSNYCKCNHTFLSNFSYPSRILCQNLRITYCTDSINHEIFQVLKKKPTSIQLFWRMIVCITTTLLGSTIQRTMCADLRMLLILEHPIAISWFFGWMIMTLGAKVTDIATERYLVYIMLMWSL